MTPAEATTLSQGDLVVAVETGMSDGIVYKAGDIATARKVDGGYILVRLADGRELGMTKVEHWSQHGVVSTSHRLEST